MKYYANENGVVPGTPGAVPIWRRRDAFRTFDWRKLRISPTIA